MIWKTVQEVKNLLDNGKDLTLKYVQLEDGEYHFNFTGNETYHSQMIKPPEKAKSAGFCTIGKSFFLVHDTISTSLMLGPIEEDHINLKRLLLEA